MLPALRLASHLLHSPRFTTRWRMLLLLMVGITCWFAFTPRPPGFEFKDADKVNHLLAFGSMSLVAGVARPPGRWPWLSVSAGMLLLGLFIEAVQSQLPARTAEWGDVLADAVGISIGLVLWWLLQRWRSEK
jgi:VanZ family protein